MWVLSTSRAELHEFASPELVPGGYAILSHVWDEREQSFQITKSLSKICERTGANPRDSSYPKIRDACTYKLAELHGYNWLWVDTCCIDQSSSADLSEAINSMHRYYSLAKMCYAYLHDVPFGTNVLHGHGGAVHRTSHAKFIRSRWHTRGWTLQELIAPTFVLFLTDRWTHIGTKAELADLLESITRIPARLLRLESRLADYSVAQRMSWAASRQTTRPEDRAYSLLGIFGINMSTLYGEGDQAFYRLQEEIMRRRADTTLFAWSSQGPPTEDKYLLAPSPEVFRGGGDVLFAPPQVTTEMWRPAKGLVNSELSGTITFSITPYGVLAHLPLIEHWYEDAGRDEVTAYLFWSDVSGNPMGLRLKPCPTSADPFRPHYEVVGGRLRPLIRDTQGRLMDSHRVGHQFVRVTWQEIYITHRPPPESIESAVPEYANKVFVPINLGSVVPFRISNHDVDALPTSPLPIELTACTPTPLPWHGDPPVVLQFESRSSLRYYAMLHLGICERPHTPTHWAAVRITTKNPKAHIPGSRNELLLEHDCESDHIDQWPDWCKSFPVPRGMDSGTADTTVEDASIVLRFERCPVSPWITRITRITTRRAPAHNTVVYEVPIILPALPDAQEWSAQIEDGASPENEGFVVPPRPTSTNHSSLQLARLASSPTSEILPDPVSPNSIVSEVPTRPASLASFSFLKTTPHPVSHDALTSESELESGDYATAGGSMEENENDLLDWNGDGGNGRRNLRRDQSVPTTPASQQAETNLEAEAKGTELPMSMETVAVDRRAGVGMEEGPGGQGESDAVDDDGEVDTGGMVSERIDEERVGFGGEISAEVIAPSLRQVTPPPKPRKTFRLRKFWRQG